MGARDLHLLPALILRGAREKRFLTPFLATAKNRSLRHAKPTGNIGDILEELPKKPRGGWGIHKPFTDGATGSIENFIPCKVAGSLVTISS